MKFTKTQQKFVDAIVSEGLADQPNITRVQVTNIVEKYGINYPHWATKNKAARGQYVNPIYLTEPIIVE